MNNRTGFNLTTLLLFFFFYGCQEEEISLEYPKVRTLAVTDITQEGAVFRGEVLLAGKQEVLETGFVWQEGAAPLLGSSDQKVLTKPVSEGKFSATIHTTLKPDTKYYVKAYAKSKDYLVYGQVQSFVSQGSKAPEILSIQPESGVWGDTVRITGSNFSYRKESNFIQFGDIQAQVMSATDSLLITTVPVGQNEEKVAVSVTISGSTATKSPEFTYLMPSISSFSPTEGTFNDTIEIKGTNLHGSHLLEIKFGTTVVVPFDISRNHIKVTVPTSLNRAETKISLISRESAYKNISSQRFSLLAPVLTSFAPDSAKVPGELISMVSLKVPSVGEKLEMEGIK